PREEPPVRRLRMGGSERHHGVQGFESEIRREACGQVLEREAESSDRELLAAFDAAGVPADPRRRGHLGPRAAREESWRFNRGRDGANRFPRKGLVKVRGGFTEAEHEQAYDPGVRATVDDGARRSADTDLFDEAR